MVLRHGVGHGPGVLAGTIALQGIRPVEKRSKEVVVVAATSGTAELSWASVLGQLTAGRDLETVAARWAMAQIMDGSATPAQVAAFGVSLKMKGVSGPELDALAATMLDYSQPVPTDAPCVDIVGTGGDRHGTVNISTMSALVVAACGVPVAKHGNRAASSKSGGADVLEALGVTIELGPLGVAHCLEQAGIGFCFAPVFHPALRHAAAPRREIGIPTVFNVLGPLTNPARPAANLIGCAFDDLLPVIAEVFAMRGRSALVVRGLDGLDEITVTGPTRVLRVAEGVVSDHLVEPERLGLSIGTLDDLKGGDGKRNAEVARSILAGAEGAIRDAVLINSAAALVAYDGLASEVDLDAALMAGIARAAEAIDTGAARKVLDSWVLASVAAKGLG